MADNQQAAASLAPLSKDKPLSIAPPAIMPADNNKTTTAPVAVLILLMVCLWALFNAVVWALFNAVVFALAHVATLIVNRTPGTKSTCLFRCVTVTYSAAAEMSLLLYGELLCSAVAALAAALPLHMLRAATTSRVRSGGWGAVDVLAWVALAATAGMHCMEVASDRIFLTAKPGDAYIFVDVVCSSVLLAVDLLAGVLLLCCSPRHRELVEQQGHDDA